MFNSKPWISMTRLGVVPDSKSPGHVFKSTKWEWGTYYFSSEIPNLETFIHINILESHSETETWLISNMWLPVALSEGTTKLIDVISGPELITKLLTLKKAKFKCTVILFI